MVLLLSNEEIRELLRMKDCISVLEEAFKELEEGRAVNRPRSNTYIPVGPGPTNYKFNSMEGGILKHNVYALRVSSEHVVEQILEGSSRRVQLSRMSGGKWLELILLFSLDRGELLAILQGGVIQSMRVGATAGIAANYLAREDAKVVGLFGSGLQARTHIMALQLVRPLLEVKVYSPNPTRRDQFSREVGESLALNVIPVNHSEEAVKGSDIVAAATNSEVPVYRSEWVEDGSHLSCVTANREIPSSIIDRSQIIIDGHKPQRLTYMMGDPRLAPSFAKDDAMIGDSFLDFEQKMSRARAQGKVYSLGQVLLGKCPGRQSPSDISLYLSAGSSLPETYGSGGGAGLGIQFAAVGHIVYEMAIKANRGRHLPIDWFLQDVHS